MDQVLVIPGHTQPVKTVAWLNKDTFVSGGGDQVVNMFRWSEESNSVEMVNCCRGHERSGKNTRLSLDNILIT